MEKKDLIKLIATGIVRWYEIGQKDGNFAYMPEQLKRGINILCAQMPIPLLINNRVELVQAFSCRIGELPLHEICRAYDEEILIVDGMPSDMCYEIAIDEKDPQGSIEQSKIMEIANELRIYGSQNDYVNIRVFIIQNPIVEEEQIDNFIRRHTEFNAELRKIYNKIKVFYEDIPYHTKQDEKVKVCRHCGWTIQERNNVTTCISNFCKAEDAHTRAFIRQVTPSLKRLKRGAMRYLCFPGKPELELKKKIEKRGMQVELWPYFDKYDLEVIFKDEKWALDVKDYSNPYHLIEKVTDFPQTMCSRNFIVIPKKRLKLHKGYKKILKAEQPLGFQFIGEDDLLKLIDRKVME